MVAVGKTPNGFKFIRISSHTPKNIQEGSAEIIYEDIDILSHPNNTPDPVHKIPAIMILCIMFLI